MRRYSPLAAALVALLIAMPGTARAQAGLAADPVQVAAQAEQDGAKPAEAADDRTAPEQTEARESGEEKQESAEAEKTEGFTLYKGDFGTLSATGSLTGYYQGANGADIEGTRIPGVTDPGYAADLSFEWKAPTWDGSFVLRLHTGAGRGSDKRLVEESNALLTDLNGLDDDNPDQASIRILEAFYTHSFSDGLVAVSLGKSEPVRFIGQNEFAGDEVSRFVGKPFVNDPVLDSEDEFAPLAGVVISPTKEWKLTLVGVSTSRGGADDEQHKDVWSQPFSDPFLGAQVTWSPETGGLPGNYRVYGWTATYDHPTLVRDAADTPDQSGGWGVGVSADQKITETVGLFARVGLYDHRVYDTDWSWIAGASLDGLIPGRDKDTLGIGVGGLAPNEGKLRDDVSLGGSMEWHLEAYYRVALTDWFAITPDIQYVANPLGHSSNDAVVAGSIRAVLSF